MKNYNFLKRSLNLLFLLTLSTHVMAQSIITIDNNPGSNTTYQTIQAAHDAAAPGDIIHVQPSDTGYGTLNITKSISIIGRSHSEEEKISRIQTITITASDVSLQGLDLGTTTFQEDANEVLYSNLEILNSRIDLLNLYDGINVTIRGNRIGRIAVQGPGFDDIYGNNTGGISNLLLTNNFIATGRSYSGAIDADVPNIVVANNIFYFTEDEDPGTGGTAGYLTNNYSDNFLNITNCIFLCDYSDSSIEDVKMQFDGNFQLSNNLFYNIGSNDIVIEASGTESTIVESNNLLNQDPMFVNISGQYILTSAQYLDDLDLSLQAGSPALMGGTNGSQMGVYGLNFNYSEVGNPAGVPTIDVQNYDNTVAADETVTVTITANAQ